MSILLRLTIFLALSALVLTQMQKPCSFRVISWGRRGIKNGTCESRGCCAPTNPVNPTDKICLGFCPNSNLNSESGQPRECPEKCRNSGIKSMYKVEFELGPEEEPEYGRCFSVENGKERGCACGVSYPDLDIIPLTVCRRNPPPQ